MNKKIVLFLLLVVTTLLIINKFFNNKYVEKIEETTQVNRKQFAMYVKDSTDDSYTEYTDSDLFPNSTKYSFNTDESYCIDSKDNVVKNVISSADGKVTVTSNKTIYCYLYFDGNLFDIETDLFLVDGIKTSNLDETPTTDGNYNYVVRYDCSDNDAIKGFGYDYYNYTYEMISSTKNKCNIYFEKMMPDIEVSMYLNNLEVEELPSNNYNLKPIKYECTDNDRINYFGYDYYLKTYVLKSEGKNICKLYFEELLPDIEMNIYINNIEAEEVPSSGTYILNEASSNCTNTNAVISYDDSTKYIQIETIEKTKCYVYLEGE